VSRLGVSLGLVIAKPGLSPKRLTLKIESRLNQQAPNAKTAYQYREINPSRRWGGRVNGGWACRVYGGVFLEQFHFADR